MIQCFRLILLGYISPNLEQIHSLRGNFLDLLEMYLADIYQILYLVELRIKVHVQEK